MQWLLCWTIPAKSVWQLRTLDGKAPWVTALLVAGVFLKMEVDYDTMTHTCNSSTWEAEVGEAHKFHTSLDYVA